MLAKIPATKGTAHQCSYSENCKLEKQFMVCTNACIEGLGEVSMQEGHVICYEPRKLKEHEMNYATNYLELTTIVHALKMWRHYLLRFAIDLPRHRIDRFTTSSDFWDYTVIFLIQFLNINMNTTKITQQDTHHDTQRFYPKNPWPRKPINQWALPLFIM